MDENERGEEELEDLKDRIEVQEEERERRGSLTELRSKQKVTVSCGECFTCDDANARQRL